MNCCVLIAPHIMIGCDWHDMIIPPSPFPAPGPHMVFSTLLGWGITAAKEDSVLCIFSSIGATIQRGSDIGPMIPHIGTPNPLMPMHTMLSGSVSEFGVFKVLVKNKPVGVAFAILVNLNLNCQGPATRPFPAPTGIVLAPNTVFAGMTIGDFIAGLCAGLVDTLVQGLLNIMWRGVGKLMGGLLGRATAAALLRRTMPLLAKMGVDRMSRRAIGEMVKGLVPTLGSILAIGSPVGYSAPWTPAGGTIFPNIKEEYLPQIASGWDDFLGGTETH